MTFLQRIFPKRRVYLDYAATTPMAKRVQKDFVRALKRFPGNPGSLSREGVLARAALRAARASVASLISAQPHQVFFTNGGTDGINRVIHGVIQKANMENWLPEGMKPTVLVSAIEHPAVRESLAHYESIGKISVVSIPVTTDGLVHADTVRALLREHPGTILVCVQYANNEIGTVHPIRDIAREVRHARTHGEQSFPYFFVDAVQAGQWCTLSTSWLGVDFMTLSGSKLCGPKHSGCMFVRRRDSISAMTFGGGQEGGLVPGTEDVAASHAFGVALTDAVAVRDDVATRMLELQSYLVKKLMAIPNVIINGSLENRLPNNVHVSVMGIGGERMVLELDARGFAVSAKSACASDKEGASHVLLALGGVHAGSEQAAWGSVRITMGRETRKCHIRRFAKEFKKMVTDIRTFDQTLKAS